MKRIAILILLLFAISQVLPMAKSLLDGKPIMMVDLTEDHKNNKDDLKEKKDLKEYLTNSKPLIAFLPGSFHRFCIAEHILPAPSINKLTPPPNFS
jgi:hypothetical protein